jgi:hypothetical protein
MKLELKNIDTGSIGVSSRETDLLMNQILFNSSIKEEVISINPMTDLIFTSSAVDENILNKKRSLQLEKEFTHKLLYYLREDEFEYGFENRADILVNNQMKINLLATKEWLNKIYVNNFNNPEILIGILRLVSRISLEEISPEGKTMAIAALAHKNMEVQECGIRAFESWGSLDSLDILANVRVQSGWLQDYLLQVIENIGIEYAIIGKENK